MIACVAPGEKTETLLSLRVLLKSASNRNVDFVVLADSDLDADTSDILVEAGAIVHRV